MGGGSWLQENTSEVWTSRACGVPGPWWPAHLSLSLQLVSSQPVGKLLSRQPLKSLACCFGSRHGSTLRTQQHQSPQDALKCRFLGHLNHSPRPVSGTVSKLARWSWSSSQLENHWLIPQLYRRLPRTWKCSNITQSLGKLTWEFSSGEPRGNRGLSLGLLPASQMFFPSYVPRFSRGPVHDRVRVGTSSHFPVSRLPISWPFSWQG